MSANYDPTRGGNTGIEIPHFSNQYAAPITPAEAAIVQDGADIRLFFTPHTTGELEIGAALGAVQDLTPETGFVLVEGFGQSGSINDPRKRDGRPDTPEMARKRESVGAQVSSILTNLREHGDPSPLDSIALARRLAQANGVPIAVADITAEDVAVWQETQAAAGASAEPSKRAAEEAFFNNESRTMTFRDAAAAYNELLRRASSYRDRHTGSPLYRWGELNNQRDQAMGNTVGHTTAEQITAQPQPEDRRLQVRALLGIEHRGGVEAVFTEAGIPFTAHVLGSDGQFHEAEPISPGDHQAYRFAVRYFWHQTNNGALLGGANFVTMDTSLREVPLHALERIYDAYAANMNTVDQQFQSNLQDPEQNQLQHLQWRQRVEQLQHQLAADLRHVHFFRAQQ
jgi:hypothetical protein